MDSTAFNQLVLQKRMLDADLARRTTAILASGLAELLFLSPGQVTFYLVSYFLCEIGLNIALPRLIAQPRSVLRLRLVQLAAFSCMATYLVPAGMLWQVPGTVPKLGALIHVFGGMLSIMLVRTAFMPLTLANSLPVAGFFLVIAWMERQLEPWTERVFLAAAVLVLIGYFILTLLAALRIHHALERARDAAMARVETQARFLATMSHELRTPLNGILGMAQAMEHRLPGQGAEVIRECARDMAAMVDDLLDNAAIEAGALRINRQPVELAALLLRIDARWRADFQRKGLALQITLADGLPPWMSLDALRLSQCLSNLLANALRITETGGVTLELGPHPKGLEARVTDTGPGLPAAAEGQLFLAFQVIETAHGATGTGLGLSITRGLARAMGGDLVFERPTEGGSRFCLTLASEPALMLQHEPPDPLAGATRLPDIAGRLVVVVDDIATNRLVLRLLLADSGAEVVELASGEALLDLVLADAPLRPDAILMDIRMPGLSGFDTLSRLRQASVSCPVIAVSADAAPAERAEALAHGFDGYLTKPVEANALRDGLQRLLPG